jgi:2-(1,2-epoxy-1,2-dihydrophenyl)acetyl-CoA isomerase
MTKYSNLLLEVKNSVARVTLNRPDAANGINLELAQELDQVMLGCAADAAVRAVLITGGGKMFCAGGNLKAFAAQGETGLPRYLEDLTSHLHHAISRMARMKPPVIAAVNGAAAGAGMSLVCACDLALAAESANFTMAYTRAGLTPDGSATYFLPRIVGLRKAMELALLNPVLSAAEACALGIVNRVVPDAELADEAIQLAERIAAGPTKAYGGVKRLFLESATGELDEQMGRETETICAAAWSKDAREGIAAFLSKRAPTFTGE